MSEPLVQRWLIRGIVQGVGYRWYMVRQARHLGLTGFVRNRRNGSVEALVAGTPEAVSLLLSWARHGPPSAQVVSVEVLPAEGEEIPSDFSEQASL